MIELFITAWEIGRQTVTYLFAYAYALALAPALHLALVALGRWGPVARLSRRPRIGGAIVAGLTSPLSRRAWRDGLRRFAGRPGSLLTFVAVSHGLNAYALVLLGPLLGKDFLLSHVVGFVLFVILGAVLVRLVDPSGEPATPTESERASPAPGTGRTLVTVVGRFAALATLGLAVGGLVAAWGFSPQSLTPADLGGGGVGTQSVNALLGLGLALFGLPPLANLFVGTYLWKIGLAHAGIVAYFCAATLTPARIRLYRRHFGSRHGVRFSIVLALAALLAGVATAALFGLAGVEIRYKLVAEQLWRLG